MSFRANTCCDIFRLGLNCKFDFWRFGGEFPLTPDDRGAASQKGGRRFDQPAQLHAHTNYSDGRATIEEMVERAAELGYEYIALTDHSPSVRIARGLELDRLQQKMEELEQVRRCRGNRKPRMLLGAEVDILSNGKLDYPDQVLRQFDCVAGLRTASSQMNRYFADCMLLLTRLGSTI